MTEHPEHPSSELIKEKDAPQIEAGKSESSTGVGSRLGGRLFYLWMLLVAALLLLIIGVPVILLAWVTRRSRWIYPVGTWGARTWLRLGGMKLRVKGIENLKPDQHYLLIANHRSYLDAPALLVSLNLRLGFVAKRELLSVPVLGQAMGYVNVVAIDRSNSQRAIETLRAATALIHSGVSFVVFAEGTRACAGELLPFKKGGFYMAMEAGVAVLPVAIKNTDKLMGKGTGEARPGTIEITLLPPVATKGLSKERDVTELIKNVRECIAREIGASSLQPARAGDSIKPGA